MPYDPELDQELYSETAEFETSRLKVAVMSYNEGPKKMQISREQKNMTTGDYRFAKLGRLTKGEAEAILPLIKKAMEQM
jgi:hypothetical protein